MEPSSKELRPNDEHVLMKNEQEDSPRPDSWRRLCSTLAWAVVLFGALIVLAGIRTLMIAPPASQRTSFKLLATRTAAKISLWPPRHVSRKPLWSINVSFTKDVGNPEICEDEHLELCVKWKAEGNGEPASLQITNVGGLSGAVSCHHHVITVKAAEIQTCLALQSGEQLYGGPLSATLYWPSQLNIHENAPMVTGMGGNDGVADPYWLTSRGRAVYVADGVPLFFSQNASHLCLVAAIRPPYLPDPSGTTTLNYFICSGSDPVATHMIATRKFLGLPHGIPDRKMFIHPIWSTWARYKRNIDTFTVVKYADEIKHFGFNKSQLELDDSWEPCYGESIFNRRTFRNPKNMIRALRTRGFRITLWTHPFINALCPAFQIAKEHGYLAHSLKGDHELTFWWNGIGGLINFTNPGGSEWWMHRLQNLKEKFGIDGFKFDAGEASYLPGSPLVGHLAGPARGQPNSFTKTYVRKAAEFGKLSEVRVVSRNQGEVLFVRMADKDSVWGSNNGLQALIASLLTLNILGYSFILPDMVGGNGYRHRPTKELFIRWLQANTFMPSIQFSYTPWDFDNETVEISKKFTALHYQYSDKIIKLAKRKAADGTPINLPIWWIDPKDPVSQTIDSEFLLGENILVAPVLEEGARRRDIYLPAGKWQDELQPGNPVLKGHQWLRDYPVELDQLAYFTRVS